MQFIAFIFARVVIGGLATLVAIGTNESHVVNRSVNYFNNVAFSRSG